MKKFWMLVSVLCSVVLSSSAFAGGESLPLLETIRDNAYLVNGDAQVARYNLAQFSIGKAFTRLERELVNESCAFQTVASIRRTLPLIADRESENNDQPELVMNALKTLQERGLIHMIVSRTYLDGETEYCSLYYFDIYTKDGYWLKLRYDWTS